jgi:hypothetical protein
MEIERRTEKLKDKNEHLEAVCQAYKDKVVYINF